MEERCFSLDPLDIVLGTISDTSDPGVLYVDVNHEFQKHQRQY